MKTEVLWLSVSTVLLSSLTTELHSLQVQPTRQTTESDGVRLVGGTSHCNGILEMKHQLEWKQQGEWRPVDGFSVWNLDQSASVVCRQLDCGSAVSTQFQNDHARQPTWVIIHFCDGSESSLRECGGISSELRSPFRFEVNCSESVRLVNGTSLCSGRVEVKSNQSWVSVCEGDFDQQEAEVVCRELDCGAPSVLQGVLIGGVETPLWNKEFQCEGNESNLLDCRTSDSTRNTCSPDKTVEITCSGLRLVGGASHCTGRLEMRHLGEWRPLVEGKTYSDHKSSSVVCRQLGCGSVVSAELNNGIPPHGPVWWSTSTCDGSESSLGQCVTITHHSSWLKLNLTCSEYVRLVNGTSLCSGRVEVRSNYRSWVPVCEGAFDQQDAEVVCRELDCGDPSVLQGALSGEVTAPMWTKDFKCEGNESALLDCRSSGSNKNTCSPGNSVGLTCSDIRLVGGTSHCTGTVEMKHNREWRPMRSNTWSMKTSSVVCRQINCGSAISTNCGSASAYQPGWLIRDGCSGSESSLRKCGETESDEFDNIFEVICSESVRLVNGTSRCSGRVEVKSNQSWVSVCEGDFDQQDAEVVCRELGCGPPSVLQGALYGEVGAPMWTKEFRCEGNESVLRDCGTLDSIRNTFRSPDNKPVGLTCSRPDYVRLVGGTEHCSGLLEMKHQGEWKPVVDRGGPFKGFFNMKLASVVCRHLDCGSSVSISSPDFAVRPVWWNVGRCSGSEPSLGDCVTLHTSRTSKESLEVICSGNTTSLQH